MRYPQIFTVFCVLSYLPSIPSGPLVVLGEIVNEGGKASSGNELVVDGCFVMGGDGIGEG